MRYLPLQTLKKEKKNIAFIDGQNLNLGTQESGWRVNHAKFRAYLYEKYDVVEAYYFLGFISDKEQDLYDKLQLAGFVLLFREHSSLLKGNKKGNVDSDIVFSIMQNLVERSDEFEKILIVSGDGDYMKLVNFLVKKGRFKKMIFPNKKYASSLYKRLGGEYFDYLEHDDVKAKIAYLK